MISHDVSQELAKLLQAAEFLTALTSISLHRTKTKLAIMHETASRWERVVGITWKLLSYTQQMGDTSQEKT
jgi:hypothetical protein